MREQGEGKYIIDEVINKPKSRCINAYYPWNENLAKSTQQDILHCEIVEEKQEPIAEFEYSIEIACALSELTTHQVGVFYLGSTQGESRISSWQKSESTETGYSILTASVQVKEPKALYREFFESSGKPLSFSDVQPHKKGSGKISESFVPIKPSVQVYERLSWPKVGFFYHFISDELVNEYQLSGGNKWAFKVTRSEEGTLSNDMLSEHEYGFILLPWKINNIVIARQHLLYTREKITQEQLSEIDPQWLDDNACFLNPEEIVKACSEPLLEREKTEGGLTTYTVQSGDLLSIIAKKHGIKYEEILALNPQISDPDVIRPGDVVVIKKSEEDINAVRIHICQINLATGKRETWGEVAAQYGKSAKELFDLNANNPAHKDGALAVGDEVIVNSVMLGNEDNNSFRNTLSPEDVT
ncbi:LysM peptidoglycan-binding domain-containing protein [Vibrio sp. Of7-15]|uniref:MIX and LysM peptidoglycan-binding domain-containing protein n=1 Tax=Vibrio sp. Of7-15 TaxID=2724879 RepID=UPI001EF272B0|nr:LysM peptidoglycan-binding domain-containing protein [Vibrio sp. Of7-15]